MSEQCNCMYRNRESKCIGCDMRWDKSDSSTGYFSGNNIPIDSYTFDLGRRAQIPFTVQNICWKVPVELVGLKVVVSIYSGDMLIFTRSYLELGDSILYIGESADMFLRCEITVKAEDMPGK